MNKKAGVVYRYCDIRESKGKYTVPPPYPFMISEHYGRGWQAVENRPKTRQSSTPPLTHEGKLELYNLSKTKTYQEIMDLTGHSYYKIQVAIASIKKKKKV